MSLAWNPYAIPGLAIFIFDAALAFVVFRAAPSRRVNRRLALFLFLYACLWGSRYALRPLLTEPAEAYAAYSIFMILASSAPFTYLFIIAATLETPLVAPLRRPMAEVALVVGSAATAIVFLARPEMFIGQMRAPENPLGGAAIFTDGPWFWLALLATLPVLLYASVAAFHAWWRAPEGSATRTRAGGYAIAFAVHDLLFAIQIAITLGLPGLDERPVVGPILEYSNLWIPIVFAGLLAYAVLRYQILDIDLRIKRGVRRGTIVAAFVIVFVAVEQLVGAFASDRLGLVGGIVAAVALAFAFRPLDRVAERIADAAMPRVEDTPAYIASRKLAIYRATVEGALADGLITPRERTMLDRLRAELAIEPHEADAIEARNG